ncbi:MAG: dicarboxylate/amino acid:cation symporter [Clostridia bacterium]|nr:dicarboxylate/amino acid:cation symporter [Clostridia bacterium]
MKKFLSNYKSTIILVAAIIVGAIVGIVFQEKAAVLSPLGDIFLNLLLVIIVPLIFFNITTAITKMENPKRMGKIIGVIVAVFLIMSLISVFVGFGATLKANLVSVEDGEAIRSSLEDVEAEEEELNLLERTASLLTVNDFPKLLSKDNITALLVMSILVGVAIRMSGENGEPVKKLLESANVVVENVLKIVMYYAPIGLGCYMASMVGTFGATIALGYAKTFVIYLVVSIAFYLVFYTIYAFIAGGKKGVVAFWKHAIPPTLTALATCSSAANIPVNMDAAKKMGVPSDIAETTIPLGTSFHKDGTIIGSMFKIMFLVTLFGVQMTTAADVLGMLGIALVANLLVTAVPIGGGTISEMFIISMMGFPVASLPILTIIATIIDAPATVLNSVGDSAASMLVARFVDGKDWMKEGK